MDPENQIILIIQCTFAVALYPGEYMLLGDIFGNIFKKLQYSYNIQIKNSGCTHLKLIKITFCFGFIFLKNSFFNLFVVGQS